MSNLVKHIVKIDFKPNQSHSQREKTLNEGILKNIDLLNERGYITVSHKINNKNDGFAAVEFTTQRMVRV